MGHPLLNMCILKWREDLDTCDMYKTLDGKLTRWNVEC